MTPRPDPIISTENTEEVTTDPEKETELEIVKKPIYSCTAVSNDDVDNGTIESEKRKRNRHHSVREKWTGKLDFIMSALSFAVGMGNVWRFPYLVYLHGGAFLIPYFIMVIFAGFPMLFLEFSFGQFARLGVVSVWKAVPIMQGIGWCMFLISFISCIYYNMIVGWSFFYFFASIGKHVPWRYCSLPWKSENCQDELSYQRANNSNFAYNITGALISGNITNGTKHSASDEYFHNQVLQITEGIGDLGGIRWPLALCLLLSWLIVFICLSKGIKSSGKITYVTSLLPYVILFILLIRGVTLEGSANGIKYYMQPKWGKLLSASIWKDAAVQVFFSMSTCWGGLITLASYNSFHNNCFSDAIVVAIGDALTSIFGGFVVFSILGHMAHDMKVNISNVVKQGPGLAFVAYPQAVTSLPISPIWALLFMLMLLNLGIGTQLGLVTTVHTTLLDIFSKFFTNQKRRIALLAAICLFCFTVGLTCASRGGMYVLQLMDNYAPSYGLLIAGLAECLAISWLYGIDRFFKDIESMLGYVSFGIFFKICWKFITPLLISSLIIFQAVDFKRLSYNNIVYPMWADGIGWMIVLIEVLAIPMVAVYLLLTTKVVDNGKDCLKKRLKYLITPHPSWGKRSTQSYIEDTDECNKKLNGNFTHEFIA